jgi:hypothetical protein
VSLGARAARRSTRITGTSVRRIAPCPYSYATPANVSAHGAQTNADCGKGVESSAGAGLQGRPADVDEIRSLRKDRCGKFNETAVPN